MAQVALAEQSQFRALHLNAHRHIDIGDGQAARLHPLAADQFALGAAIGRIETQGIALR